MRGENEAKDTARVAEKRRPGTHIRVQRVRSFIFGQGVGSRTKLQNIYFLIFSLCTADLVPVNNKKHKKSLLRADMFYWRCQKIQNYITKFDLQEHVIKKAP
jgi:hypothetical protein